MGKNIQLVKNINGENYILYPETTAENVKMNEAGDSLEDILQGYSFKVLTRAEFNALTTEEKNDTTIYFIKEEVTE